MSLHRIVLDDFHQGVTLGDLLQAPRHMLNISGCYTTRNATPIPQFHHFAAFKTNL